MSKDKSQSGGDQGQRLYCSICHTVAEFRLVEAKAHYIACIKCGDEFTGSEAVRVFDDARRRYAREEINKIRRASQTIRTKFVTHTVHKLPKPQTRFYIK